MRTLQYITFVLVASASLGAAPAVRADEVAKSAAQQVNKANELVRSGDIDGAIVAYKQAKDVKPDLAEASYNLAVAQYRKGDMAAATSAFQTVADSPNNTLAAKARYNLGNCDYASAVQMSKADRAGAIKTLDRAIGNYRAALDADANDADARTNIELAASLRERLCREQQAEQAKQQENAKQQNQQQHDSKQQQESQQQSQQQSSQDQNQHNNKQQGEKQQPQSSENSKDQQQKSGGDSAEKNQQQQPGQQQQANSDSQSQPQSQNDKEPQQSSSQSEMQGKQGDKTKEQQSKPSASAGEQKSSAESNQSKDGSDPKDNAAKNSNDKPPRPKDGQSGEQSAAQSAEQQQDRPQSKSTNDAADNDQKDERSKPADQMSADKRRAPASSRSAKDKSGTSEESATVHEQQGKSAPQGELKATTESANHAADAKVEQADAEASVDGVMTHQEAEKMLQAIRDRDMMRRLQRQAAERDRRIPVDRDW